MDENARPHTTDEVLEAIALFGMETMSWPLYSPDLNIIENVWVILKSRVYSGNKKYSTEAEITPWLSVHSRVVLMA